MENLPLLTETEVEKLVSAALENGAPIVFNDCRINGDVIIEGKHGNDQTETTPVKLPLIRLENVHIDGLLCIGYLMGDAIDIIRSTARKIEIYELNAFSVGLTDSHVIGGVPKDRIGDQADEVIIRLVTTEYLNFAGLQASRIFIGQTTVKENWFLTGLRAGKIGIINSDICAIELDWTLEDPEVHLPLPQIELIDSDDLGLAKFFSIALPTTSVICQSLHNQMLRGLEQVEHAEVATKPPSEPTTGDQLSKILIKLAAIETALGLEGPGLKLEDVQKRYERLMLAAVKQGDVRTVRIGRIKITYALVASREIDGNAGSVFGGLIFVARDRCKIRWQQLVVAYHEYIENRTRDHTQALRAEHRLARRLGIPLKKYQAWERSVRHLKR